jgi:hypothetical protein
MKLRKIAFLVLVSVVTLATISGSVVAYMVKRTQFKENTFTPAVVTCELHEVKNADTTKKTSITVENTGNVNAYMRVRLVSYWVDPATGAIAAKPSPVVSFTPGLGWVAGSGNTYYYQAPVAPGDTTYELLGSAITLTSLDGLVQVVEVFAEAIQAQPTTAVTDSWGVTLSSSGNVISAP